MSTSRYIDPNRLCRFDLQHVDEGTPGAVYPKLAVSLATFVHELMVVLLQVLDTSTC
jgi:hypothetical protein